MAIITITMKVNTFDHAANETDNAIRNNKFAKAVREAVAKEFNFKVGTDKIVTKWSHEDKNAVELAETFANKEYAIRRIEEIISDEFFYGVQEGKF